MTGDARKRLAERDAAHWSVSDALRDASDQQAEHIAAVADEAWNRDGWPDDDRPTLRELARDEQGYDA